MRLAVPLDCRSEAIFDGRNEEYRMVLQRTWCREGDKARSVCFILLNPSTATADVNDPTVAKCEKFARIWGYTRIVVTNLFAYRATDPRKMKQHPSPIGPLNNLYIVEAAREADLVICAWGRHGEHLGRAAVVLDQLKENSIDCHALGINKDGSPEHPLYIKFTTKPVRMEI